MTQETTNSPDIPLAATLGFTHSLVNKFQRIFFSAVNDLRQTSEFGRRFIHKPLFRLKSCDSQPSFIFVDECECPGLPASRRHGHPANALIASAISARA